MEGIIDGAMSNLSVHSLEDTASSTAHGIQPETPTSEPQVAVGGGLRGINLKRESETAAPITKLPDAAQAVRSVLSGAARGSTEGTAGMGTAEDGPSSGTDEEYTTAIDTEYLTALERMTALKYKGDMFLLQGNLHAAALAYSRGLEVKCPDNPSKEILNLDDGYILTMVSNVVSRIYVYSCLSERAAAGGEEALSREFLRRALWDSRELQHVAVGQAVGFMVAAHALVKLGNPAKVAVAMLESGVIRTRNDSVENIGYILREYVRKGFSHGDSSLLSQVLENQDKWQDEALRDQVWLEGMTDDKHIMDVLSRKSRLEESSLRLEGLKLQKRMRKPMPFRGSVLMDERHPSLIELDSAAMDRQMSALTERVLKSYSQGLYGEKSCREACCQQEVPPSAEQSASGCSSEGIKARMLKAAKRCLHIGNAQAEAGELAASVLWYTRGITVLLSKDYEHFKEERHAAGALATALALLFNRSQIFLQLAALSNLSDGKALQCAHQGLWDALWCAYYGRGWAWGAIALSQALAKSGIHGRLDWVVLEEEVKKKGAGGSPLELVQARDAARVKLTKKEKADALPWSQSPRVFKTLATRLKGTGKGAFLWDMSTVAFVSLRTLAFEGAPV